MSFLTGKTREHSGVPQDIRQLRQSFSNYLLSTGPEALFTGDPIGGTSESIDLSPYERMFAQHRAESLAEAKEAAGTLTGSGLGNVLGATAGRSALDENAFLANLLEGRRRANEQRKALQMQLAFGFMGQGVGGPQLSHQPGLLDYLFQGAAMAAPYFQKGPNFNFSGAPPGYGSYGGFAPGPGQFGTDSPPPGWVTDRG